MTSFPSLLGTWVGTTDAVVLGNPPHHAAGPDAHQVRSSRVELTFRILGQEGRRFWGEVESAAERQPVVGVIENDGRSITAVSSGGVVRGTLLDADTLDYVYARTGEILVAACNTLRRR